MEDTNDIERPVDRRPFEPIVHKQCEEAMTAPIDTYEQPKMAITVAAELARQGHAEAAAKMRDLIELAKAYQQINMAYRAGGRVTPYKAIDVANRLGWIIGDN